MVRHILHVDMNAFFASVEQQANPALQGLPVAVVGSGRRTVITTSSYEARARGVKTGMAIWEGKRACPELVVVVGDNRKYMDTSRRIVAMMREYTPLVEVFSIDEAFLDVTESQRLFGSARTIAYQLKARIRHCFGLTCSVGIAPNKLLAKLASDMQKPDGLTVITPEGLPALLERIPVGDLCGVGKKVQRHLEGLGIHTCGQLGRFPLELLEQHFGVVGRQLKAMGQGLDTGVVLPDEEQAAVKSVGHSMTLRRDVLEREELLRYLLQLSEMVGRRARRYGLAGRTLHLGLRFSDLSGRGMQETMAGPINQSQDIYQGALQLLERLGYDQPVRLVAIRLTNLCYQGGQLPLMPGERRQVAMIEAMDRVNNRFGDFSVTYGSLLANGEERGSHVISPAWRPEGVRFVNVQ